MAHIIPERKSLVTYFRAALNIKPFILLSPQAVHPPSEGSQVSRKRVRYPEITSTTSMRPIARESAGGAESMPDIDGKKSPGKQDSSVKAEVQLSL